MTRSDYHWARVLAAIEAVYAAQPPVRRLQPGEHRASEFVEAYEALYPSARFGLRGRE